MSMTTQQAPAVEDPTPSRRGVHIQARDLRHAFVRDGNAVTALWDFTLDIPSGQFVSIVGPSGCGKTTFLQIVGGLVEPGAGELTIDGESVDGPGDSVGYMLARDALLPWRSAQRNVEFSLEARKVGKAERAAAARAWLEKVHLGGFEDARVTELSQGMRQRVAIARTLAAEPRCLLMDEPFAALDAQTRALVQYEFVRIWENLRPTVVLITHDLSEAIALSDRVVLMSHRPGRIVADMEIDLPRPRDEEVLRDTAFLAYHQELAGLLRHEVDVALSEKENRS
ncbi:MAG: ABC transporter ATP-binding protein [Aeromicrobium sp.]|uniref:ABC transporter ATP-binding protein n=1 Tax=Aeromicrobium sp. TaxID=1871063 RepID=UPI00261CAD0C|nr:ABC transporter ATP-binding protein [Aeromicrobium sp.]MDF1706157.1 ABC transporter ATP-binding protein [Aeromicrobium sp.]